MKLTVVFEIEPPDEKAVELLSTPVDKYGDNIKNELAFQLSCFYEDILDVECVDVDVVSMVRESH